MAATLATPRSFEVVDLRHFRGEHLERLLTEQTFCWKRRFLWDFSASKEILQRYLDLRNLSGHALVYAGQPVGYSYFVHEDRKALIGDLFVSDGFRHPDSERLLMEATIKAAIVYPGVRRVEGQLLALSFEPGEETIFGRPLRIFRRHFMLKEDLSNLSSAASGNTEIRFLGWADHHLEGAAGLIADAYSGHVDGEINDQYRSYAGARRFLFNTTQHPGCGVFYRQAAVLAAEPTSLRLRGLCLGSLVQSGVGHITQLCVAPDLRRKRLGGELLWRTTEAFRRHGCHGVSLTVTASNETAIRLYERFGFQTLHTFPAFVWEAR